MLGFYTPGSNGETGPCEPHFGDRPKHNFFGQPRGDYQEFVRKTENQC